MKANQPFRNADDAVSPVIGVILMVAITVVLAAVVFVLVSDLGETGGEKPQVAFIKDENGAAAGGFLTVGDIKNGPVALADLVIGGSASCSVTSTSDATNLQSGDQITCSDAGTITVSDSNTNTLLYTGEFQ